MEDTNSTQATPTPAAPAQTATPVVSSPTTPPKSGGSKKFILILVLLLFIILAAAGLYMFLNQSASKQPTPTQTTTQTPQTQTSQNVFSTIKEALSKSLSLKCDYTDEQGRRVLSYMKAGAIRSDITASDPEESASTIIKDNKMYFWNGKEGTMMEFDISEMMEGTKPGETTTEAEQNPGDVVADLEKYKQYCAPSTVSDELFVPPTDVEFTDLTEIMKAAPSIALPSGMTQEDIEALQQQNQE